MKERCCSWLCKEAQERHQALKIKSHEASARALDNRLFHSKPKVLPLVCMETAKLCNMSLGTKCPVYNARYRGLRIYNTPLFRNRI